jgi:putative CocE/NonD family hydrolase
MLRVQTIMAALLCTSSVRAGAEESWSRYNIVVEQDVPAVMRDGVTLRADIYRPNEAGRFPALLMRTPYDKRGSNRSPFVIAAAKRGYVVVVQDVRGQYGSDGRFEPYKQEIHDGYDTIEWVAQLPYVNGKVGTFGLSYPGAVQWLAATAQPPHLVAMAPGMTFASVRHFIYHGGIFNPASIPWLLGRQIRERRKLNLPYTLSEEIGQAWKEHGDEWMQFVPLPELPLMKDFPYWKEWAESSPLDPAWDWADIEAHHEKITVPALNFTGWNDDNYAQPGAIRNFMGMRRRGATEDARTGQRLIIGPWTHGVMTLSKTEFNGIDYGPNAGFDHDEMLFRFFDYWLKSIEKGYASEPPVQYFVMGDNIWRWDQDWPPASTEYTELYLHGQGVLSATRPANQDPDQFVYDPRRPLKIPRGGLVYTGGPGTGDWSAVTAREDILFYTSSPLDRDIETTGQIIGKLWVSSTAPDTDFAMRLLELEPNGGIRNFTVAPGVLRARYRSTEAEQPPEPLKPGEPTELTIGLGYTSIVIKAGSRLQLYVASSVFPNVHPNTWEPFRSWSQAVTATQTIYHDRAHLSRVILPLIPR